MKVNDLSAALRRASTQESPLVARLAHKAGVPRELVTDLQLELSEPYGTLFNALRDDNSSKYRYTRDDLEGLRNALQGYLAKDIKKAGDLDDAAQKTIKKAIKLLDAALDQRPGLGRGPVEADVAAYTRNLPLLTKVQHGVAKALRQVQSPLAIARLRLRDVVTGAGREAPPALNDASGTLSSEWSGVDGGNSGAAPAAGNPDQDNATLSATAVPNAADAQPPTFTVPFQTGDKIKPPVRINELAAASGRRYFITNTQAKGGFGKFHYAMDTAGHAWGVKEFRSDEAPAKSNPQTHVTKMLDIERELRTIKAVGGRFTVHDVINVDGKVYAVMPLMSGEVGKDLQGIPRAQRQAVGRSIMAQMAGDLAISHENGYMHRDVKLANALWNKYGEVAVSDFGLAREVGDSPVRLGWAGTPGYVAPEIVRDEPYDARVDVWSLGLALADVHVHWSECPLSTKAIPYKQPNYRARLGQAQDVYEKWRQGLLLADGSIDMERVGAGDVAWDSYFRKLKEADPDLCQFILECMLVPNPDERASMEQIAEFAQRLQPRNSDMDRQAAQAFRDLDANNANAKAALQALDLHRQQAVNA